MDHEISDVENITAFTDATIVEDDPVFAGFRVCPNNTFKPVDISDVLTRNYQIEQGVWTHSDAPMTVKEHFNPFTLLAGQGQIQDKLSWFRFIRAEVKVSLRINSTQFNYGKLMVGFIPCANSIDAGAVMTLGLHQCRPITVSANANEVVEFTIPWTLPIDWFDMSTGQDPFHPFGWVEVQVLLPLRSSSQATASCNYAVFAQFQNIELAGYRGIPQSQGKDRTPQTEAADKAKSGSTQGVLRAATGLASQVVSLAGLSEAVPIIEGIAPVLEALGPIVSLLGFAKPTSVETTRRVLPAAFDWNNMSGVESGYRLCADPEQSVASDVCPESNWDMLSVARVPSMHASFVFSSSTTVGTRVFSMEVNTLLATVPGTPAYIDVIRSMFYYWRGGLKVKFEFASSTFFSARLRIVYNPEPMPAQIPVFDQGNVVSQIVDIRGDTNVTFTVPYLASTRWLTQGENPGWIEVYLINELVAPDPALTNAVQCVVWVAAADDFQTQAIYNRAEAVLTLDPGRPKSQGAVVEEFSGDFEGIAGMSGGIIDKSTCDSEQIYSWEAWVKRYEHNGSTASPVQSFGLKPASGRAITLPFALFNFARGSLRVTMIGSGSTNPYRVQRGTFGHGGIVPQFIRGTSVSYHQFECPWFSKFPYESLLTQQYNSEMDTLYTVTSIAGSQYRAYGEDIEFGWLLPTSMITLHVA